MKISEKDKRALTLCGFFLGVVIVYMCGIDPYVQRYDAAMQKIAAQEKKLSSLKRQKKLLRPRQRKLRTTRKEVKEMLSLFGGEAVVEERLSSCIRSFQEAASVTGTVLHSIRPLPVLDVSDANFDEYRFELSFSGSYETVQRMLYQLETGKFLNRTRQMDVSFDKGNVNCRLLAEVFFYKAEKAVAIAVEDETD